MTAPTHEGLPPEIDDSTGDRTRTGLERQLVAAVGWCAEQGKRRQVHPELIRDPVRRRILELVLAQVDDHGGTGWTVVLDRLLADGDAAAAAELAQVATSDGFPAMLPALVDRLEAAAAREQAWADAVALVERHGCRVVPAEEVGT